MSSDTPPEHASWDSWVDWAVGRFGAGLRVACSLSMEDTLLVDAVAASARGRGLERAASPTVFVLDTGRLHEESYRVLESLRDRYDLTFDVRFPLAERLEPLLRTKGPLSFYASVDDRRACCEARKVEPLGRALAGASAWMTGQRRAQSTTRAGLAPLEADADRAGLSKLNPLALVDDATLWQEARARGAVIHPLHKTGYPSIGCAPCTRAIAPGEDARAGRWWWEDPANKECGLHVRHGGEEAAR